MSRRIAEALLKFSEAAAELAYAFGDENTPQDGVASPPAPIRAATPIDAELEAARPVARIPQAATDSAAFCPVHGTRWTIRPAGVSKVGKPYNAFYKCDEKDGDAWCQQKPPKAWVDAHPIRGAAA